MNRRTAKWLALLLALAGGQAPALESDRDQPIEVEADRVTIDDTNKVSRYSGSVRLTQGSLRTRGDEITLHSGDAGPRQMIVVGDPATFRQQPEGRSGETRGEAGRIEHNFADETTLFLGNARLWQEQETFSGDRIEYDASRDVVRAQAASDGSNRVRIVIQPRKRGETPPAGR